MDTMSPALQRVERVKDAKRIINEAIQHSPASLYEDLREPLPSRTPGAVVGYMQNHLSGLEKNDSSFDVRRTIDNGAWQLFRNGIIDIDGIVYPAARDALTNKDTPHELGEVLGALQDERTRKGLAICALRSEEALKADISSGRSLLAYNHHENYFNVHVNVYETGGCPFAGKLRSPEKRVEPFDDFAEWAATFTVLAIQHHLSKK